MRPFLENEGEKKKVRKEGRRWKHWILLRDRRMSPI